MLQHVDKMLGLAGSSPISVEDTVQMVIAKAHEAVRHISEFR